MSSYTALFENIRARAGMFVSDPTYAVVSALVIGYDLASHGGVLCGFREWLIPQVNGGNNLSWDALVLHLAFPGDTNPWGTVLKSRESQDHAIDVMFRSIHSFDEVRSSHNGMRQIYADYERWLRKQDWYTVDNPLRLTDD